MPVLHNAKHEAFCQAVASGKNGAESARVAGYAANSARVTASKLLTNANVKTRIDELKIKIAEAATKKVAQRVDAIAEGRVSITRDVLIDELWENVQMAKAAVPVYDKKGEPTGEYQQQLNAANKALDQIATMIGCDKPKQGAHQFDGMTEEQIDAYIATWLAGLSDAELSRYGLARQGAAQAGIPAKRLPPLH